MALTQGDPAGVGPELLARIAAHPPHPGGWRPLLVAERSALEAAAVDLAEGLVHLDREPDRAELDALAAGAVPIVDPVGRRRRVTPGDSGPDDARGALAALDAGLRLARCGVADALLTAPLSKASIARHALPGFRGHTGYLAEACGLTAYGRDHLMTFLTDDLQVALLTTHLPLAEAIGSLSVRRVVAALELLEREAGGRVAVAGLNPHAGEGGLMGDEEERLLAPAVAEARRRGIDAHGPESADSLFARARRGEFDWVLALYHDQGLIAVKTVAFGGAVNWTLGLPVVRTSVDHGTAFDLAGRGRADDAPMRAAIGATLGLLSGELPRRRFGAS